MPTVPMLTPTAVADAWHAVTAPGGYEWWYFDAEAAGGGDGDLRVVAILFEGFVFHPGYLRAYARYRRRPTRVAPPLPGDFPCAYFVVYRGSAIVAQFMTQVPAAAFIASGDRVDVTVGPNRLTTGADGALRLSLSGTPWVLTGRGPRALVGQTLSAELTFRPRLAHGPMERAFLARSWSGADHRWVLANPLCDVTGEVTITGGAGPVRLAMNGRGYHDHNYGTGPIGPGLRRWMWGRVLSPEGDHALMFHLAQPRDRRDPEELHLVEADGFGLRELSGGAASIDWSRATAAGLRFPARVRAGPLTLSDPQVIDASPFYLRLAYAATVRGEPATAFCEVAYPHRLRWPVLGRMIEMSIRKES
jgi:carotenoid 1,2-hydratase